MIHFTSFQVNLVRLIFCCSSMFLGAYLIFGNNQTMWRVRLGFALLAIGLIGGNGWSWR